MKSPWALPSSIVLSNLSVDANRGLSMPEVGVRLKKFGKNNLIVQKKVSWMYLLIRQVKNPVVYVLVVAAIIAFILKETLDASAIFAIVIINIAIGFIQEAKAEASINALAAITSPKARVFREEKVVVIDSDQVCVGDILILEAGDYVPADARVIVVRQFYVNESILTGESLPVEKEFNEIEEKASLADRKNMIFSGTAINKGSGKAVVTSIGKHTEIGKIAEMMASTTDNQTPLQIQLEIVSRNLLVAGVVIILVVIAIGFFRDLPWIEVLMNALSLSIAAIPEGLPTIVTLALVMGVRRMSRKKALIRKMDSVETLGTTDIICTDKTGTLTTGKMEVREIYVFKDERREQLLSNMGLCNNASLNQKGIGDTTEIALLEFVRSEGIDIELLNKDHPRDFEWSFDSDRKRMSVTHQVGNKSIIYTKGAPESILSQCNLSEEDLKVINIKITEFSKKGMRLLGFAWKEKTGIKAEQLSTIEAEADLEFLGLSAMADPPRKESLLAIKKCQESGIRVIMITGDHPETASAIAFELTIIKKADEKVLTGAELDALSPQELAETSENVSVYARVSPQNKLDLVSVLKSKGHIVAMTGDGVNDAPALKMASIGIAMGKGGTEVARQASSMVLTDDNFATIVDAIEEGRAVNGNIKRTLQYLLSTNLAELMFILIATIFGFPIPLLPINILWLNLVSDGLPSLALATEKIPSHYLEENKGPIAKSFFNRDFYQEMIFVSFIITVMCLVIYKYGLSHYDILTARSIAFSFLVYVVLFRSFSCRSKTKTFFELRPNYYHLVAVILPILLQFGMQEVKLFLDIFKIKAIPLQLNFALLCLAILPVTLIEVVKIWKRHLGRG